MKESFHNQGNTRFKHLYYIFQLNIIKMIERKDDKILLWFNTVTSRQRGIEKMLTYCNCILRSAQKS